MNEKTMVNDILENVKADLSAYQKAIAECSNAGLRQTFQQIRNSDESFQYELFKLAESNTPPATLTTSLIFVSSASQLVTAGTFALTSSKTSVSSENSAGT